MQKGGFMRKTAPRVLAVLAALSLMTGLLMLMSSAATAAPRTNAQTSASPSGYASPSGSTSPSGSAGPGIVPSGSGSASPSASASPSEGSTTAPAPSSSSSVLGQTIPKTGAGMALPLLVGGVILATMSLMARRLLGHRA